MRHQPDVGLDRRRFSLFDHQHGHYFHPHQEWIQRVGPVAQHIVLQTHFAAGVQESLEVLIIVVRRIFVPQQHLDQLLVVSPRQFQLFHVTEPAQSAGNVA